MLHSNSKNSKVLLTTPDYPPKLGGLSTFSRNIEFALKNLGIDYDLLVWNSKNAFKMKDELAHSYEWGLHIHYQGGMAVSGQCEKNINFLHGSEILFTSPNWIKKVVKKALKFRGLRYLEASFFNISISEFTQNKVNEKGLHADFGRDLIFHNCIDLSKSTFIEKSLDDEMINFICVARDVPHKNLSAARRLVEAYALHFNKKTQLFCTKDFSDSPLVSCINIHGKTNEELRVLYSRSHFNLLLSRDDSNKGFYEGFGLTVLEAGCWGTPSIVSSSGGLPEACHDGETGWVLKSERNLKKFFSMINSASFNAASRAVFDNTHRSHGRELYEKLLKRLLV